MEKFVILLFKLTILTQAWTFATSTTQVTDPVTTTMQPPAEQGSWNVSFNGHLCIKVQMAVTFQISYPDAGQKAVTEEKNLPTTALVDYSKTATACAADNSYFTLSFDGWLFKMNITKDDDMSYVNGLMLKYSTPSNSEGVVEVSDLNLFQGNAKNFYKCDSQHSEELNKEVTVVFSKVRLQAFRNDTESDFKGTEEECMADENTSAVVPIVVGASLGALIILVIIFYIICRKKRQSAYQSM